MDYWQETIAEGAEECSAKLTKEQVETIASWAEGAHDNYSLATGQDCIPNPMDAQVERKIDNLKLGHNQEIAESAARVKQLEDRNGRLLRRIDSLMDTISELRSQRIER